jgi:hypothetical protein
MTTRTRRSRSPLTGVAVAVAAVVAAAATGCGGSDAAAGARDPAGAASGFVSSVRLGDGAAACAYLTEGEQDALVTNAAEVTPALDTGSCESVVTSFHEAHAGDSGRLDGTLENVSDSGDFASATWVWAGGAGEQAALLAKKGGAWLLAEGGNDFPSAVLHFFDQS